MKLDLKMIILTTALLLLSLSVSAQKEINQYEPTALFERGVLLFENHHYGSALECFEQYISLNDNENRQNIVYAKYYEAVSSLYLGQGETKIINFVKENPTNLMANHAKFLYANSLFKNKKYRDAIKIYDNINTKGLGDDELMEYQYKKGLCYYQTNNIEKAMSVFYDLIYITNPYQDDARYYYAHIQYIKKDYEEALFNFNKLKDTGKYGDIADIYILNINYEKGNYSDVTANCEEMLRKADKDHKSEVALMIAESWFRQKDYLKSLEYYDRARENTRRSFPREIEFRMGFCKMKNQDYENAIDNFEKVTKGADDELKQYCYYYMAQCYINTNQDKFARNAFFSAYKSDFNDTISEDALFNYAKLSFIPGIDPFNETVTVLNEFIEKKPNSSRIEEIKEILIHFLLNSKDDDNALYYIKQYSKLTPELERIQSQLTYNLGIKYYNTSEYDKAISYLTETIDNSQVEPEIRTEACYWLADSYYQNKNEANAIKLFSEFIQLPGASNIDIYPLGYYNLGYLFINRGDFNNALKRFKDFLNVDNTGDKKRQSDAWMRVGDCCFIQHRYNNAITAYNNAIKINSRNADYSLYQQGMGYGALGHIPEKIACLDALASNYKNSIFYAEALYETGMAHLSTNDQRSAIAAFNRVYKEKPRSFYARKALMKTGMLYYNNDEYDKALTSLKQVVSQYPNTEESREALNIIGNIYKDENKIQDYFDYIKENDIAEISIDEQDSLTFRTIEKLYSERKYTETLNGANQYISKYPNGAYLLNIHYYAMISMEKTKNYDGMKTHIKYIINQPDNDYTDNALIKIAKLDYDSSNYSEAAGYYERLINITENENTRIKATEGAMKSYYFNKNYDEAITKANALVKIPNATQNQKNQANYILGKSYLEKNEYSTALSYFDICARDDKTVIGAESAYHSVVCCYQLQKYDEAENKVYYVSDHFSNYTYWVARSFIALGEIYIAKDNIFQAKETLKSVVENYPGEDLKQEAQEKLNAIETNENNTEGAR